VREQNIDSTMHGAKTKATLLVAKNEVYEWSIRRNTH
jgi:hypothetical protein